MCELPEPNRYSPGGHSCPNRGDVCPRYESCAVDGNPSSEQHNRAPLSEWAEDGADLYNRTAEYSPSERMPGHHAARLTCALGFKSEARYASQVAIACY